MATNSERKDKQQEMREILIGYILPYIKQYLMQFKSITTSESIDNAVAGIKDFLDRDYIITVYKNKTHIRHNRSATETFILDSVDMTKFIDLLNKNPEIVSEYKENIPNGTINNLNQEIVYNIANNSGLMNIIKKEEEIPLIAFVIDGLKQNGITNIKADQSTIEINGFGVGVTEGETLIAYAKENKLEIYRAKNKLSKLQMAKKLLKIYGSGNDKVKQSIDTWLSKVIVD